MSDGLFRLLIVEDDPDWGERLQKSAQGCGRFGYVELVSNKRAALKAVDERHYHFVSIDQNIPDAEGEIVSASQGLDLCEEVVRRSPFTGRCIFTGNGQAQYGNRVGRLDETQYIEKRVGNDPASEGTVVMDAGPYIDGILNHLQTDYAHWCLDRAGTYLPRALGGEAEQLSKYWKERNWTEALQHLACIRSYSLELAWAQTAALAVKAQIPLRLATGSSRRFTEADKENDLGALWPQLETSGYMEPWWKFLSAAAGFDPGGRNTRQAFDELRKLRNRQAHWIIREGAEADIAAHLTHILRLLDLLAGWAEMPLIESPRRHPQLQGVIQFNVLAGAPPWRSATAADEYDDIPAADHAFVRWRQREKPFFLDLHPFVLLARRGPRHEPYVLLSLERSGTAIRRANYRALVGGEEVIFDERHAALLSKLGGLFPHG